MFDGSGGTTLLERMDSGGDQQRDSLRHRLSHFAVRIYSGKSVLHRPLRDKSSFLAQIRRALSECQSEIAKMAFLLARLPFVYHFVEAPSTRKPWSASMNSDVHR